MAAPLLAAQSIWLPAEALSSFPRSVSPPPSRGNSLAVAPSVAPQVVARQWGSSRSSIGQRSMSPMPSMVSRSAGLATNSSSASSLEAPARSLISPAVSASVPYMQAGTTTVVQAEQAALKLQDAQVWFDGKKAPLSTLVQDTVTQQFLKMKESMNQEVQRCVQMLTSKSTICEDLLQRLEVERSMRDSTLVGLRHDFDRQQSQITEVVQSRLSTSAVQDIGIRERDDEVSGMIESIRADMEVLRTQNRNALVGSAATSEQNQQAEKAYLELRRDFEEMTAENQRCRSSQAKMEKAMKKLLENGSSNAPEVAKELAAQRECQQETERMVLELRKELQNATDELNGVTAWRKYQEERDAEQQKTTQEQQKLLVELRSSVQATSDKLVELANNFSELQTRGQSSGGEAALINLKQQMEAVLATKRDPQMLSASFGADLLARVEKLEESARKSSTFAAEIDGIVKHIQDLTKTVNLEKALRIDLTQSLDAYRSSYTQTSTELRDGVGLVQERVVALENVQLEDRGLREKTMGHMEVNLQELMSVTQLEREARLQSDIESARVKAEFAELLAELKRLFHVESTARVNIGQSLEAFRMAQLQTSSDTKKDTDALREDSGNLRVFLETLAEDFTKNVLEQRDVRAEFDRVFDLHCGKTEEIFLKVIRLEEQFQEISKLLQEDSEMHESLRVEYLSTCSEFRAQLEVAMDKLGGLGSKQHALESQFEESGARTVRAVDMHDKDIAELRKLIVDGMGSETRSLRGGLENMSNNLQTTVVDLEVERTRRAQEASALHNEVQVLRSQLCQVEATSSTLRSTVVEVTAPVIENLKESVAADLGSTKTTIERTQAAMAKESSELKTGMRAMQEKLVGLETKASEDRGWRQQAVQDLEGILGDMKHISPTAACTRSLPTLASALRLCKTDQ